MNRRSAAIVAVSAMLAIAPAAVQAQAGARRPPARPAARTSAADSARAKAGIKLGFVVRPDSVTVGDPFILVVSIDVPAEATVQWPAIADTAAMVAPRTPTRVTSEVTGARRRETAEYALAAWDVGRLPVGLPDATVRLASGVIAVPLRDARILVKTVLPLDTSLHVPKPARDLFPRVVPWWDLWWLALLVVAALAALWWAWRRLRRKRVAPLRVPLDPFARAMHDFDRLQRLALADVGERGRAVALAVEIMRTYLAARLPDAVLSQTSPELLGAIGDDARVPSEQLTSLLADADIIKFAHRGVTPQRARDLQDGARAIVEAVERAELARLAAEAAARQAEERKERAAKTAAEDAARRKSKKRPKAGAGAK